MEHGNALGDFLRARRELVRPADVGLAPGHGLRRVPGLRREEVALLAGISAEYYLRLEQGRDRSPSAQVASALARVLRLDADATAHLLALAAPPPRRTGRSAQDTVPPGIGLLIEGLNVPAFVINRYHDILAVNPPARRLTPLVTPGVNWLRVHFAEPSARVHAPEWERGAAAMVAHLRAQAGTDPSDARLQSLISELSQASTLFRELWDRHEVHRGHGSSTVIRHPVLGDLHLMAEKFAIVGSDGLEAVLMHAAPGSPSAEALARLLSAEAEAEALAVTP
ncbi:helix-turn-helix domain-containing protein [Catenuloplanes sp. NPDC051500]|uniref:helix-turn-helix domain-containing protein n=1 Tax=Catenuloplanes sp. NPDC051500 TaxID=3363959 RepID=UPI0037A2BFA0